MFVIQWCEHLRDGEEYGTRIVPSLTHALSVINEIANGFTGANHTFRLFKLGEEIKLVKDDKEVIKSKKVVRREYKVQEDVGNEEKETSIPDRGNSQTPPQ
jgi:hypothetical protein